MLLGGRLPWRCLEDHTGGRIGHPSSVPTKASQGRQWGSMSLRGTSGKNLSENYLCFSTQQVKFWTLDPHPPTVYFKVLKTSDATLYHTTRLSQHINIDQFKSSPSSLCLWKPSCNKLDGFSEIPRRGGEVISDLKKIVF